MSCDISDITLPLTIFNASNGSYHTRPVFQYKKPIAAFDQQRQIKYKIS